jgi:hypothetical protein
VDALLAASKDERLDCQVGYRQRGEGKERKEEGQRKSTESS